MQRKVPVVGTESSVPRGLKKAPRAPRPLTASASLVDHAGFFFAAPTPRIMATGLATVVLMRLVLGRWSQADAVLAVALLLFTPFFEWGLHVFILHFHPVTWFGRTFDPWIARSHREHHLDPPSLAKNPADTGRNFLGFYGIATLVGAILLGSAPLTVDFVLWASAYALAYEWMHYLIHSNYRPHSRYFRSVRLTHLMHHYRNEHRWFGVVSNLADVALGTHPDPSRIERSATAMTLGVMPSELD